jgi:CheY-like chemotaxis protein
MTSQAETGARLDAGSGTGRLLVVEDNDLVRRLSVHALQQAGHTVVEAPDGGRALDVLSREAPFDLLLIDLVLPGMNGYQIAEHAVAISPEMRVLFTSGYASPETLPVVGAKAVRFLQKPYDLTELRAAVAALLATT